MKRRDVLKMCGATLAFSGLSGCLDQIPGTSEALPGYTAWISADVYSEEVLAVGVDRTSSLSNALSRGGGIDTADPIVEIAVGSPVLLLVSPRVRRGSLSGFLTGGGETGSVHDVYVVNQELMVFTGSFEIEGVSESLENRGFSRTPSLETGEYSEYRFYRYTTTESGVIVGVSSDSILASSGDDRVDSVKSALDAHGGRESALVEDNMEFRNLVSSLEKGALESTLYLDQPRSTQSLLNRSPEPNGSALGICSKAGLREDVLELALAIMYTGEDEMDDRGALEGLASGADETSVSFRGRKALVEAHYESVV